jgi:hypothetical protein
MLCAKSFWSVSGNTAILRSPKVLLPAGYSISYFWRNTSANKVAGHDTTYFEISTNGGVSWSKIDTLAPATQNAAYIQRTHDLNAYSGTNFFFRFRHVTDNSGSACNIYLDDISIFQTGITPILLVAPANQNVTAPLGTTTFSITSNMAWTAVSDQSWCTVTPSGTGNGTISASYTENTSGISRVSTITITVSGLSPVTVTVTQGVAAATLTVTPSNQNVSAAAGNTAFTITSNSAWTASSNQTWCTVSPSGSGNGNLNASYTENTELVSRIAEITVTVAGLTPVIVTVTQQAGVPFLLATPANQDVSHQAGTTNFAITSNDSWTAISDAGWCSVTSSGIGSGTLFATYAENIIAASRIATITITFNGASAVLVTVTQQSPAAILNVTPLVQTVNYPAGVSTFAVTSNTNWTTTCDASWCQVTASGTGSGVISIAYGQNETMVVRTANITVNAPGLTPVSIQLIQLPSYLSLEEAANAGLLIYPNPAHDYLKVILSDAKQDAVIQIYTLNGDKVVEQHVSGSETRINVSGLGKGNYMIKIINQESVTFKKVVII